MTTLFSIRLLLTFIPRLFVVVILLAWCSLACCDEIHDAVKDGDLETVKTLLKYYPNLINSKDDKYGATPLHWAAAAGSTNMVELLLKYNADINARANDGATPIQWASATGHQETLQILQRQKSMQETFRTMLGINGAQESLQNNSAHTGDMDTNLSAIALFDPSDIGIGESATLIVGVKGNPDAQKGYPQLTMPQINGLTIKYLGSGDQSSMINGYSVEWKQLRYSVSSTCTGAFTIPPLDLVVNGRALQTKPIKLNIGQYPIKTIQDAARQGDTNTIEEQLRSYPNLVFIRDDAGQTPLQYAVYFGQEDAVKLLIANKADINVTNSTEIRAIPQLLAEGHHLHEPFQTRHSEFQH